MIVSHFEMLFKPQAPANPTGSTAVDRVVQGYFLEITNLEDRDFAYALEFLMSPADAAKPERDLAGNTIYFVDTPPGTDNQAGVLSGAPQSRVYRPSRGFVRIPAGGTALVAVLPSIFGNAFDPTPLTVPNFECRGHVRITLPALFPNFPRFSLFSEPQAARPVRVLLTPQSRATFFKADNSISDQVQATLTLAEGKAEYALPPEPGRRRDLVVFEPLNFPERLREEIQELSGSSADALASLLSGLDPDDPDLGAFNASLKKAGISFAVEKRRA